MILSCILAGIIVLAVAVVAVWFLDVTPPPPAPPEPEYRSLDDIVMRRPGRR